MSVLTRVQLNPEITTDDSTFVTDLVAMAKNFVVSYCQLSQFPELAQGYSRGGTSPSTDLTSLATNTILVSVAGESPVTVTLTLANCTSGAATAAELQTQIQAIGSDSYPYDEVTVTYSTYYEVLSGRYGTMSQPRMDFYETSKHVAQAMKLTEAFGGTEEVGAVDDLDLIDAAVEIATQLYRRVGVEGIAESALHQGETSSKIIAMLDPVTLKRLQNKRQLW